MKHMMRACLAGLLLLAGVSQALAQAVLTDISYRQADTGGVEVTLHFEGAPPEVRGFRVDNPSRLSIDLKETVSQLEQRRIEVDLSGVNHVAVLTAASRTRLMFALDEAMPYIVSEKGNTILLRLGGAVDGQAGAEPVVAEQALPTVGEPEGALDGVDADATLALSLGAAISADQVDAAPLDKELGERPRIENIDFRRGDDGASRLVVSFDRDGIDSRVSERAGNRIVADLRDVELPPEFTHVLDVSDFGTPIQRIEPQPHGQGVVLMIEANGEYSVLSTHIGRLMVIEARPVSQTELEQTLDEQFPYTGKRITLNFQDVEVREVLAIIAQFTGLNLVASDSVQGSVTLNLQNVPWDQALDLVLKSHGLDSRQSGNVLTVAPASELAEMERQVAEARAQQQELAPLVTQYLEVKYAKAAELAALLQGEGGLGLLSDRGRLSVDARTNMLILQDTQETLDSIRLTIDRLDIPVRQVQIEARIVIARDSASQELGVNWGLSTPSNNSKLDLGGAATGISPPQVFNDPVAGELTYLDRGGMAVDLGGDLTPSSTFGFGYLSGDILLDLELRALESEGKSQTISQPKVITANQRTAVIKQGQEIAYQEATSSGATNVEFKEAVLSLEVTPQITPDNRIIMDLIINNDDISDVSFNGAPAIDTNEIRTQVLVNNGETVVLGGILTTEQIRQIFKTPLLGDLPVLGHLFRHTEESNAKVELLVFITPKIIDDNLALR